MTFLLNIFWFPRDLFYLTVDSFRISMDMIVYRPMRESNVQPCIHCRKVDVGYRPRLLPSGLRKYQNRWMGCALQTCVQKRKASEKGPRRVCMQDGGFVKYSRWISCLCGGLLLIWGSLFYLLLQMIL
jgi:hypothetical protein